MKDFKIVIERHADGYVACPLGVAGIAAVSGAEREYPCLDTRTQKMIL